MYGEGKVSMTGVNDLAEDGAAEVQGLVVDAEHLLGHTPLGPHAEPAVRVVAEFGAGGEGGPDMAGHVDLGDDGAPRAAARATRPLSSDRV